MNPYQTPEKSAEKMSQASALSEADLIHAIDVLKRIRNWSLALSASVAALGACTLLLPSALPHPSPLQMNYSNIVTLNSMFSSIPVTTTLAVLLLAPILSTFIYSIVRKVGLKKELERLDLISTQRGN